MSDPVARTLEAACALAEWEMRGGRGRDDGSWGRHVDAVIAATKGIDLDGAWLTPDSLAAALHQKGYCWEGNAECSPREHRYEAQLLIQAAKEASE